MDNLDLDIFSPSKSSLGFIPKVVTDSDNGSKRQKLAAVSSVPPLFRQSRGSNFLDTTDNSAGNIGDRVDLHASLKKNRPNPEELAARNLFSLRGSSHNASESKKEDCACSGENLKDDNLFH